MILVYSTKQSLRLKYILDLIFKDVLGISYLLTTDLIDYTSCQKAKLKYAESINDDELGIISVGLLFEVGIKEQNIGIGEWKGNKILFKTNSTSEIPFDFFSAVFYLLTRYEEYLPHIRDKYDRFEAESSLAFQHGFLHKPLVNYWIEEFKKILKQNFPEIQFKERKYSYLSSIDIDNAFAFKQKGVMRTIGGYARAIVNFFWIDISERTRVLFGKQRDPYDTYDFILDLQNKHQIELLFFFLLGDYGTNDKNLPSNNKVFQSLIKKMYDYADVGIHPSFGSNYKQGQLKREISRLSSIIHKDITSSRQHFLKLNFPNTYKNLIENGITDDYSMGYASNVGFRASFCYSYNWFDLDTDTETNLRIHPFAVMEATLRFYLKLNPSDANNIVKPLNLEVRKFNGEMITIWHNETLSDWREWRGWKNVYEEIICICK